jgi:hypothetical protein
LLLPPDGVSQFVEVDLPVDNASTDAWGHTARRSAILPAQSTMVTEMPEGRYQDWHPASRRQLLVVLSGTLEVETSDRPLDGRQRNLQSRAIGLGASSACSLISSLIRCTGRALYPNSDDGYWPRIGDDLQSSSGPLIGMGKGHAADENQSK